MSEEIVSVFVGGQGPTGPNKIATASDFPAATDGRYARSGVVALGSVSGAVNCDLSAGAVFTATLTGDCTFSFTNWPSGSVLAEPVLIAQQDGTGGHAIGVSPTPVWTPSGPPEFSTAPGSLSVLSLWSPDNGVHVYASNPTDASIPMTVPMGLLSPDAPQVSGTWEISGNPPALTNPSNTPTDIIGHDHNLAAGTWNLDLLYAKGSSYGAMGVELDGAIVQTIDQSGASVANAFTPVTMVVPTSGIHRVSFTPNTGYSFPSTAVSDDFNRSNEVPLSQAGAWSASAVHGASALLSTDASGHAVASASPAASFRVATVSVPCEIWAVESATATNGYAELDLLLDPTSATFNGYGIFRSFTSWMLYRNDNGVATNIIPMFNPFGGVNGGGTAFGMSIRTGGLIDLWVMYSGVWQSIAQVTDTTYSGPFHATLWTYTTGQFDSFATGAIVTPSQINIQAAGWRRVS